MLITVRFQTYNQFGSRYGIESLCGVTGLIGRVWLRLVTRCGNVCYPLQLLVVDRSARGSMKTAAKCVSACESQD